jgi:hypothetical protein
MARIEGTMPFRVFLSYSLDPTEMALAWRLQILVAAHGIEMYVPQHGNGAAGGPESVQQACRVPASIHICAMGQSRPSRIPDRRIP